MDTRKLFVTMPGGSVWSVPVQAVIDDRLAYYRSEGRAEPEDERPTDAEIMDWAAGNMNWSDVAAVARLETIAPPPDFQEGWVNGPKRIAP